MVGFSGLVIDFSVTFLFKEKLGMHKYFANALGFSVAATNNFYWNKIWTFQDTREAVGEQFASFVLIALVGLVINTLFIVLFHRKMKLTFYLAKFLAIIVVVIWNFLMNYFFTFVEAG